MVPAPFSLIGCFFFLFFFSYFLNRECVLETKLTHLPFSEYILNYISVHAYCQKRTSCLLMLLYCNFYLDLQAIISLTHNHSHTFIVNQINDGNMWEVDYIYKKDESMITYVSECDSVCIEFDLFCYSIYKEYEIVNYTLYSSCCHAHKMYRQIWGLRLK